MGKFELNYMDDEVIPFIKQPAGPKFRFVTNEGDTPQDSGFQKALCYSSYYVMTFTAFCAFAPGQVANAAEIVASIFPL